MRMRASGLVAIALFAGGCRAIIGVQEVTVIDADAGEGADAAVDAPVGDAGPGNDTGTPPPPPDAAACLVAGDVNACIRCCKETFSNETPRFEKQLVQKNCVVCTAGGQCGTPCASSTLCGGSTAPTPECAMCTDPLIKNGGPACKDALDACRNAPANGCINVVGCFDQCH